MTGLLRRVRAARPPSGRAARRARAPTTACRAHPGRAWPRRRGRVRR
ncbi:hypothetical protein Ae168Ps1_4672 [Pseudonocardia sp. Ae168_Ps1]|nr:hypothetical protein Ae168Ps1_4672 [Pseudonocardia sp. Ae168_Ps1]